MNKTQKTIALAIGGAFALSIAATSVNAATNPFEMKTLTSGYQVADNDTKMKDGKCATGKCGATKKATETKVTKETKEASCSVAKAKEGKCSTEKAKEASCSAEKAKEGTCSSK
jgi:uncharacterized low-complexity protein